MKLYRFKTFRTSYYFPQMTEELGYMYGLYAAYGGKLSQVYWWLFRHCGLVRWLNKKECEQVEFPYQKIVELEGKGSLMAFNLGTPGAEQKISILGFDKKQKEKFFAKYSEKDKAMYFTRNEIQIYQMLGESGLTPLLLDEKDTGGFVWMKASFVKGSHYPKMELTKEVVELAIQLSKYHLNMNISKCDRLRTCLSHGDFCPWNMLIDDGKIKLIDWEMAAERPLGYDLFKYMCQISLLFTPEKPIIKTFQENQALLNYYFTQLGIDDWRVYREEFLKEFSKKAK